MNAEIGLLTCLQREGNARRADDLQALSDTVATFWDYLIEHDLVDDFKEWDKKHSEVKDA